MPRRRIYLDASEGQRFRDAASPLAGPPAETGSGVRADRTSFVRVVFGDEGERTDFPCLPSIIEARGGKILPQSTTAHGAISPFAVSATNSGYRDVERQTIYLVDNEPAARGSLERLLQSAGYEVLSFESPTTFLAVAPSLSHGCVLLDVTMPELNGFDVLDRLHQIGVRLGVVMMAAHGDVRTAVNAMKAGAANFLEKPCEHVTLFAALKDALAGAPAGSNANEAKEASRRIAQLTPREDEVLAALAAGTTTKSIAFELGISVRTVEAHRGRMLERLGTKRLAEAIRLFVLASFN